MAAARGALGGGGGWVGRAGTEVASWSRADVGVSGATSLGGTTTGAGVVGGGGGDVRWAAGAGGGGGVTGAGGAVTFGATTWVAGAWVVVGDPCVAPESETVG